MPARADGENQRSAVAGQYAGRVGLFLRLDDFVCWALGEISLLGVVAARSSVAPPRAIRLDYFLVESTSAPMPLRPSMRKRRSAGFEVTAIARLYANSASSTCPARANKSARAE